MFSRDTRRKTGIRDVCKSCAIIYMRFYVHQNREKVNTWRRENYIKSHEQIIKKKKEYRIRHKEVLKIRQREYNKRSGHSQGLKVSGRVGFPGYAGAHNRVNKVRGKARLYKCFCGDSATEWGLNHESITQDWRVDNHTERFEGKVFSLNIYDYNPVCHNCNMQDGSPNDSMWGVKLLKMGKVSRPDLVDKDMPTERAKYRRRRNEYQQQNAK